MTSLSDRPVQFSTPEFESVHYRPVSKLAVIALLLGLISAVAFINPVLWLFPIGGVVLSLFALRQFRQAPEMVGRSLAALGLVLSLFFLSAGPVRWQTRRTALMSQAKTHADHWLELVRAGHLPEAHQLTLDQSERQPPDINLDTYYAAPADDQRPSPTTDVDMPDFYENIPPHQQMTEYFKDPLLEKIVNLGQSGDVRSTDQFEIDYRADAGGDEVLVGYELRYRDAQGEHAEPFRVTMKRRVNRLDEVHWLVLRVRPADHRVKYR